MPAVTVDNILTLPRVSEPVTEAGRARCARVTTAPSRLRGRGLPRPPRLRRRRPAPPSTRSSTWTRWARSSTRRASPRAPTGTRTAASRPSPTSSTARSCTRTPTAAAASISQRRHPVDDRRARASCTSRPRRSRSSISGGLFHGDPAVGQPAAGQEVARPRATRTSAAATSRCSPAPTAARWCASSPASVDGHAGPGITHTPITVRARDARPRRAARPAVAHRLQRPGLRAGRRGHASAPTRRRSARASSPCSAPATTSTVERRREPGVAARPSLDVFVLGGRPIREPVVGLRPVRHEHPARSSSRRSRTSRPAGSGTIPTEPHPGHDVL